MASDRRRFLEWLAGSGLAAMELYWQRPAGSAEAPEPEMPEPLARLAGTREWRELKSVWQEMTRHGSGGARDAEAFSKLSPRLDAALKGVGTRAGKLGVATGTTEELASVVRWRYDNVRMTQYPNVTCYKPSLLGVAMMTSASRLERQCATLAKLEKGKRIQPAVAAKARESLARQAEFISRAHSPAGQDGGGNLASAVDTRTGEVKPDFPISEASRQVGWLLLDLCRP